MKRLDHCPHCGTELTKVRSIRDHRRFFGIIAATYNQWPERNEFQPTSAEHLRAWLLCRAGYHKVQMIPVEFAEDQPGLMKLVSLAVEGSVKAALSEGDYAFTRPYGAGIAVFRPKSMDFATMDQKDFGPLREAVEQIIEAEIGVKSDDLLREARNAA
jgi:hypothetical protein